MAGTVLPSSCILLFIFIACRVESGVDVNTDFLQAHNKTFEDLTHNHGNESYDGDSTDGCHTGPTQGEVNAKGDAGPLRRYVVVTGPPGPKGSAGPRGLPGPQGMPGNSGMNGYNGATGECFCLKGPRGPKGSPGNRGIKGSDGSRGPQGPPGDEGSPGPTGQKGEPGNCTGEGWKGKVGPPGLPGKRGVPGEKGDIGEPGEDAVCDAQFCGQSAAGSDRSGTEQSSDGGRTSGRKFSAFSVSRYGTAGAVDDTTIVTWDHEFSNVGGDFSPDTGIFNCSIPGFYYFTFHIYKSSTGNYPMVRLMLNGEVQISIIDADYWDSEDSSSNSVILELGPGDAVCLDLYHGRVLHSSYYRYTTFSGTLIHRYRRPFG